MSTSYWEMYDSYKKCIIIREDKFLILCDSTDLAVID